MEFREWWREFDDIDLHGGEINFIENDGQDMIDVAYHDGMFIDVGLDNDKIYNVTVVESNDEEGWKTPLCVRQFADREKLHDQLQDVIERFRADIADNEENEKRVAELLGKYGMDFINVPKDEITALINDELNAPKAGDAEYLRLLCAYLFCVGDKEDAKLINKVKYSKNADVMTVIESEWITSLENGGEADEYTRSRDELIADILLYYMDYDR